MMLLWFHGNNSIPNRGRWAYHGASMRPSQPPPDVPSATDAERMDNAVRKLFTVSKDAYLREEDRLKRARDRKRPRTTREAV